MDSQNVMVTVCCLTYNHEPFIGRALEGFVRQKTNFRYEVLVHDDASTDGTAEVIRKFEEKYPDIIKPIYQTENQHTKKVNVYAELILPRASGKYVALCEGDDYWTDEHKLQLQVDAMEAHPECYMCVHRVQEVFMDETPNGGMFPPLELVNGVLNSWHFLKICQEYSFHTSSYFFKMEQYRDYRNNLPEFTQLSVVGDVPMMLYFGQLGPVYYVAETMSCYRRGVPGSWTVRHKNQSVGEVAAYRRKQIDVYLSYDKFTQYRFHDLCMQNISKNLAAALILEKSAVQILTKEYREYLKYLSNARKGYLLAAILLPNIIHKHYVNRLQKNIAAHGV